MIDVHLDSLLLWGVFATGILTVIMSGSQQMGWSRMSLPFMLGSLFTAHRRWMMLLGFVLHFIVGCAFALFYALIFESLAYASWWLGLVLGALHGFFMLVVIVPLLPALHPRMASKHHGPTPTRLLEPPGFLSLNYGRATPAISLAAHLAYGLLLGAFYQLGAG